MGAMDGSVAWRAAAMQGVSVAVVAIVLGAALSREFFEDCGWAAGPGAWAACALLTAARAAAAGRAGARRRGARRAARASSACMLGAHWLGPPLGVVLFGLWCGRLAAARAADSRWRPDGPRARGQGRARHRRHEGDRPRDRRRARRRGRAGRGRVARRASGSERPPSGSAGTASSFDSDDLDAVPGVIADVEAALGPIDIYVANTGGPPAGADPLGFTREQWEAAYRTLVLSPMAFLERLLPGMRARGWGRVVAVGSMAVREPIAALQLSNAHRPGLVAAFKILAKQAARRRRDAQHGAAGPDRHRPDLRQRGLARGGRGRSARRTSRRAGSARSRSSPRPPCSSAPRRASYITGTTLLVDGGLTASV